MNIISDTNSITSIMKVLPALVEQAQENCFISTVQNNTLKHRKVIQDYNILSVSWSPNPEKDESAVASCPIGFLDITYSEYDNDTLRHFRITPEMIEKVKITSKVKSFSFTPKSGWIIPNILFIFDSFDNTCFNETFNSLIESLNQTSEQS